ncbi:2-oxoacid:acceptor oxidoreductase subunit alpha [Tindallia californiensis]|uniref:2-oxoglutarate ferredoxin oxidoreductase subunit alpha n=1 Tax=Tindallia californiensis TaxID=159292 RepID=A0A1H3INA5_9FIRM|nr:2-oxoacid:acceptor oxidoreductase subunit alpha [Tindallia californiensis]SDY29087.1 2-oxoglutarate ferredoxin oxidoreductase subunit alpha [Tindallia californiensis]
MDHNLLIGGSAGQGMDTLSSLLERYLMRQGYHVFVHKDYMSRVRGGHNFIQIRFSDQALTSHRHSLDLILAFDKTTIEEHQSRLLPDGYILCDEKIATEDDHVLRFPIEASAKESGNPKTFTSVFLGLLITWYGLNPESMEKMISQAFQDRSPEANINAYRLGTKLTKPSVALPAGKVTDQLLLNGNQAIALGAIAAGVTFYSAYPMTPSTSIMNYLASKQEAAGIVVEQAEDEIAAINMAIGANYAGVRAMTGTSGGGFSLMTEALGLSGITETPLVVANVQRPGPATGLPTRTEQSDLSFLLTASHGETPRMITALRNPKESFYQTARAFNLSEKYQLPVILLSDQYLADYTVTTDTFDLSDVTIERHLSSSNHYQEDFSYKRYALTENGISPRLIPGKATNQIVLADSDEHDEAGHITESATTRIAMMKKRMGKMDLLQEEIEEPWHWGVDQPEVLLLAWGSTAGPLQEALSLLQEDNDFPATAALIFGDLWPLPVQRLEKLAKTAKTIVNIEQNYTGQLAKLIRQETGIKCQHSYLKYDGRQMTPEEIVIALKKEVL